MITLSFFEIEVYVYLSVFVGICRYLLVFVCFWFMGVHLLSGGCGGEFAASEKYVRDMPSIQVDLAIITSNRWGHPSLNC